jgi:hypothetical protein
MIDTDAQFKQRLKKIRVEVLGALGLVYPKGLKFDDLVKRSGSTLLEAELMGVMKVMISRGEVRQHKRPNSLAVYRLATHRAELSKVKNKRPPRSAPKVTQERSNYGELIQSVREAIFNAKDPISGSQISVMLDKPVQDPIRRLRLRGEIELAMIKGRSCYWRKARPRNPVGPVSAGELL